MRAATEDPSPTTSAAAPASDLDEAPDFTLPTFSGATFKLSDHAGKLPVVLNFWAPW
ncbi:MAG: peroxiredoxin family protein [Candidatus Binatia bacterium]